MKIPLKWLAEYVDLKGLSDKEISDGLTMSGTENEIEKGVEFPKIVVGEIKEITAHPNADKIRVTKTDVGKASGGVLQIVCGAPNIEVGQKVPVALPGAPIGDFVIEKTKIRGIESNGMLASESELGISDDHSGIMILDPRAKVGQKLEEVLNIGGTVLEAEITPNRGDCLSMLGIAREASAALGRKLINKKFAPVEIKSPKLIQVEVQNKEKCPRYIAKVLEGVRIGTSPKWMQERLAASGVRPINNVVDVTNYVMLELGQPLHAFDAKKVKGKIIVRSAQDGEKLVTLDGMERKLNKNDLVIADEKNAIALAGVMGGLNSEVDDKSTDIVLEAAVFNSASVRRTAQKLALRSEASNRFEKGIPLTLPEYAIERAAELILEAGGKAGKNTDELNGLLHPSYVGVRQSKITKFLGVHISEEKVFEILRSLGFKVEKFDFKKEARIHLGKPYVFGSKYSTHSDMAFDCSYLTDYIYRKISRFIGHTALAQCDLGTPVETDDLRPGDLLFVEGYYNKEVSHEYYVPNEKGGVKKVKTDKFPKGIRHVAIYIGDGRIINAKATEYDYKKQKFIDLPKVKQKVVEENLEEFIKLPDFAGARRFVENPSEWLSVSVPWWRLDVRIEEDILEEIGRMFGYVNFPSSLPSGPLPYFEENKNIKLSQRIRDLLSGIGVSEIYTYSFVSQKASECTNAKTSPIKVANPINPDQEQMRTSLSSSLFEAVRKNQENRDSIKIYEIASTYLDVNKELPTEIPTLAVCLKSDQKSQNVAFAEIKGILEFLSLRLNLDDFDFQPLEIDFLSKGQSAGIYFKKEKIGYLGLLSEKTKQDFGLKHGFSYAEINLNYLVEDFDRAIAYKSISRFPEAERHYNLLLNRDISAATIKTKLKSFENPLLLEISLEDIYLGEELPEGQKSVTIKVVFGSSQTTLKEEEINSAQKQLLNFVKKSLGGDLRT